MKKTLGIISLKMNNENKNFDYLYSTYLEFFNSFDLNIIIIPYLQYNNYELLKLCDGFLLPGGDDINPILYNESLTCKDCIIDNRHDEIDFFIIDYAYKNNKFVIGICRGMQIINVYFKGSLYQDMKHKVIENNTHNVIITPENLLIKVNSFHHQAVKTVGNNLEVFATSEDGIIEGIKHKDLPIIGVQWHPELLKSDYDYKLFKLFLYNIK